MTTTEQLLEAGALVSTAAPVEDTAVVDQVSARRYQHPALGERAVVRLIADNVAAGDDLTMEFYGFGSPEVTPEIGQRRRRSMGFPAWALINDPDHAHFALKVVKQLKREARRARSKPGHAWDAIIKIADSMDRSVVHFLPSFWEEVGRVFISTGNANYAGRAFGKARDAEDVHALEVDEQHLREVFLEFALAGALTVKVLSSYAKTLMESLEPADAWRIFRDLCVRRTLGGMPPWTSMPKDLRRLIKAAGLNQDQEEAAFLKEVLGSEAMKRVPSSHWKTYSKVLKKLAAEDAEIAGLLLNLKPSPSDTYQSFTTTWLDYLETWGLLENLWSDKRGEAAGPRGGLAAWIERTITRSVPEKMYSILLQGAERLRQDERPVQLTTHWYRQQLVPVDLVDLALEHKIPVADPLADARLDLGTWATNKVEGYPRDPVFMVADPRFKALLSKAVDVVAGDADFEKAAAGKKALTEARHDWLSSQLADLAGGALPSLKEKLSSIKKKTSVRTYEEFPDALPVLRNVDVASVLRRTLQGGIFDELGWPALEEAVTELQAAGAGKIQFSGEAPFVVIHGGTQVIVVGPKGRCFEHELRVPNGAKQIKDLRYLDGELLVRYVMGHEEFYYWSGDKEVKKDTFRYMDARAEGAVVAVPGGGVCRGGAVIHAGGNYPNNTRTFLSDGQHFWYPDWEAGHTILRELNPADGSVGRRSLPSFLEEYVQDGWRLGISDCELLYFGDDVAGSPLGSRDGLIGWRLRYVDAEGGARKGAEAEGIDGRSWSGLLGDNSLPIGILEIPGTRSPVSGSRGWNWNWNKEATLWDASGTYPLAELDSPGSYNVGQAVVLPPLFWHCYSPRDEAGSAALRNLTAAQAEDLLAAAQAELAKADAEKAMELPESPTYVQDVLKEITHPRLARGVLGIVREAAILAARHQRICEKRDPDQVEQQGIEVWEEGQEGWLREAVRALGVTSYRRDSISKAWIRAASFLAGDVSARDSRPMTAGPTGWMSLVSDLPIRLWRAFWAEEDSGDQVRFLKWWMKSPMSRLEGRLCFRSLEFDGDVPFPVDEGTDDSFLGEQEGSRYVGGKSYYRYWQVLEHSVDGQLRALPNSRCDRERELQKIWTPEQLGNVVRLLEERGAPQIHPEFLGEVAEALDISTAEAALIWVGFVNFGDGTRDFLPKSLRERLGLKIAEADNARTKLSVLDADARREMTVALLDGDIEELWEPGPALIERLKTTYRRLAPARLQLADALTKEMTDIFNKKLTATLQVALAAPAEHPWLKVDGRWELQPGSYQPVLVNAANPEQEYSAFDTTAFRCLVELVPLFAYRLPAGDPGRQALTAAVEQARERLKNSDLLFQVASSWGTDEKVWKSLFPQLEEVENEHGRAEVGDDGAVVGIHAGFHNLIACRPSRLDDAGMEQLRRSVQAIGDHDSLISRLELWEDEDFGRALQRLTTTPLAAGEWEANPLASVPELVEKVRNVHGLDEDPAVLYLQILTLPDPTTANIRAWNGWTAARVKKAAAPLVAAEVLLEAKRSRAGRNFFLPGPWEALKAPHLPIETWKAPLYKLERDGDGKLESPLRRILPLRPVPELFDEAWRRIEDGDVPRYEEVS